MNSCKTHISKNLSNKVCVKEGSGGRSGVLTNYQLNESTVACAKKYEEKEFKFYELIHAFSKKRDKNYSHFKILDKYIPKNYNILCKHDNNTYFVIENLMPNKESIFMDLKLGYESAIKQEAGIIKYSRHKLLDNLFTISGKYGFRLEGSNFPIIETINTDLLKIPTFNKRSREKYKMQRLHPIDIFKSYFNYENSNKSMIFKDIKNVIKQLKELIDKFCIPNIKNILDNKFGIGLIGVSLFIYKKPHGLSKIKLIDFAHPSYYYTINNNSEEDSIDLVLEEAINFTQGLESILEILEQL